MGIAGVSRVEAGVGAVLAIRGPAAAATVGQRDGG